MGEVRKEEEEEEVFDVERILDKKSDVTGAGAGAGKERDRDKEMYCIQWKKLSVLGHTWEPRANLASCSQALKDFDRLHQQVFSQNYQEAIGPRFTAQPDRVLHLGQDKQGHKFCLMRFHVQDTDTEKRDNKGHTHEVVPYKEAVEEFPQLVIDYLRSIVHIQN